jgi:hypothetical protein
MSISSTGSGKKSNLLPIILIVAGLLLAFTKPIYSIISPAKLDIQIIQAPIIMPSIYKVYANGEALQGKYSLFKMMITNNSSHPAENVEVSYEISNYVQPITFQKITKILPGQTVVVNCYPNLPDKIVEKTTSSKENVNITVKGSNIKTIENSFAVQCKGRNEFMYSFLAADEIRTAADAFDNKELLSCLVTPEDPIIKYLTQKIQEKILKGETASVENKETEGVRVMLGVYEATLRSHMVYSGTSGVPEKVGDVSTIVQSIRLPREVVTGKTGLCIELSLLYASVMMCAGMDPLVYLVPGHAYPGFKMNGRYYAIESTAIGGEGMGGRSSGEDAYKSGMKSLDEFIKHAQTGDPGYMILDVRESIKEGALAMELKDDNFLRQKIDEIAQSFDGNAVPQNINTNVAVTTDGGGNNPGNDGGGGGGNTGGGNTGGGGMPSGYKSFQGPVSFGYPASWKRMPRSEYTMPQCTHVFANAAQNVDVEVYNFPGYSTGQQGMMAIQQHVNGNGMYLQYQPAGQSGGFAIFNGTTSGSGFTLNWVAAFKNTGNGVAGIAIGAYAGVNAEATAQKILGTLR